MSTDGPTEHKAAGAVIMAAAGAGLMGLVYALSHNVMALIIVVIGLLLVAAMLFGYTKLLKVFEAKKAGPLERSLAQNAAATPQGVNDPGRRARLDEVRKSFEAGVAKFRSAGKNVYTFPWYILVGEPGGGKTEAIRQCGAGFPPGLQDSMQGTGGTINMNWWFTNNGIILDTAGRLMFEEVPPGSNSEWGELLKLLRTARANCPINGMLLVIPADSLMKDAPDAIDRKAGKIAHQLDQIQRELGVRFPVFILVSKCDLIAGFNEFFNSLDDAQQQSQMLGWSNPASLDEPFHPETVDAHLRSVRDRLIRHRYRLLLDPIHTENPGDRRIEQVDAMYGLPDSLTQLSTRLRRYLEQVFVSGAWSNKPLFLRGIYFTCAMQKGAALDLGLAATLGIPVQSLPQGRVWQRDRAYFLRDLFTKKVFVEKGLVTRANNANQVQRRRKIIVMTTGIAAALILGSLTWLGYRQLDQSLERHRAFWTEARDYATDNNGDDIRIVKKTDTGYEYQGGHAISIRSEDLTAADLQKEAVAISADPISIPIIFRPVAAAMLEDDLNARRKEAAQHLYESAVIVPTVHATQERLLLTKPEQWTAATNDAFVAVARLALAYVGGSSPAATRPAEPARASKRPGPLAKPPSKISIAALLPFVVNDRDPNTWNQTDRISEVAALQSAADAIYREPSAWPPATLKVDPDRLEAIDAAEPGYVEYWTNRAKSASDANVVTLLSLRDRLLTYRKNESALQTIATTPPPETIVAFNAMRERFNAALEQLKSSSSDIEKAYISAKPLLGSDDRLEVAYGDAMRVARAKSLTSMDELINSFPAEDKLTAQHDGPRLLAIRDHIKDGRDAINQLETSKEMLASLQEMKELSALLVTQQASADRTHQLRIKGYELLAQRLADDASAAKPAGIDAVPQALNAINDLAQHTAQAASADLGLAGTPPATDTNGVATVKLVAYTIDAAAARDRTRDITAALEGSPRGEAPWKLAIAAMSQRGSVQPEQPRIPLSTIDGQKYEESFDPPTFKSVNAAFTAVQAIISKTSSPDASATTGSPPPATTTAVGTLPMLERPTIATEFDRCQSAFESYRHDYNDYWASGVFDGLEKMSPAISNSWKSFSGELPGFEQLKAEQSLKLLGEHAKAALLVSGDQKSATLVEQGLTLLASKRFQERVALMLKNWRELPSVANTARQTLLKVQGSDYLSEYTVGKVVTVNDDNDDDFASRYWKHISTSALQILANDANSELNARLHALVKEARFPLGRLRVGESELTPAEVKAFQAKIDSITLSSSENATTLAGGKQTTDPTVDAIIDDLRGKKTLEVAQRWLDGIQKRIAILTDASSPLGCTVSLPEKPGADTLEDKWPTMTMLQGSETIKRVNLRNAGAVMGELHTPGNKLTCSFDQGQGKQGNVIFTIDSTWASLALLEAQEHTDAGELDANDPKLWKVTVVLRDALGTKFTQQLQLKFSKAVPPLPDPPVLDNP